MRQNILFLCTGNSCRSQMAEGWAKSLFGEKYNFYSAGTKKHGLNLRAVQVMHDAGIDISHHQSNTVEELEHIPMHFVFTVCTDAHENCPIFPSGKVIHIGFDDPPKLTIGMSDEQEVLSIYSRVRDEIEQTILNLELYLEKK